MTRDDMMSQFLRINPGNPFQNYHLPAVPYFIKKFIIIPWKLHRASD